VLQSAPARPDHHERVVRVRDVPHQGRRPFDHLREVRDELRAVEAAHVVPGQDVGDTMDLERDHLLVAHKDRGVVQDVEVFRGKRVRLPGDRVETGGDLAPTAVRLHDDGDRFLEPARDVHEDTRGTDEGPTVV
jgi:hypothetical protein